jgi:hypothetical protein
MNLPEIKMANITDIRKNPDNPRIIKDKNFKALVKSINGFPEMLSLRTVVVDENMMILGGNQRFEACKALKYEQVPIMIANNLTEDQKKEFIIKDNTQQGEWDDDKLKEWDDLKLKEWGIDVQLAITPIGEKDEKLKKFISEREKSRARGKDKNEVNFWVCLVFQSFEQKKQFLEKTSSVPCLYGQYINGEKFAEYFNIQIEKNKKTQFENIVDKKLCELTNNFNERI